MTVTPPTESTSPANALRSIRHDASIRMPVVAPTSVAGRWLSNDATLSLSGSGNTSPADTMRSAGSGSSVAEDMSVGTAVIMLPSAPTGVVAWISKVS